MSKAFFKEDTVPDDGPAIATRPAEPLPLTLSGRQRLVAEHASIDPLDEATKTRRLTLERILATTFVRDAGLRDGGVGFGCEVDVEDERGERRTYWIVGPDEVDARAGRISEGSPLGEALVGRRAGEVVERERRGSSEELTILAVRLP